MCASEGQNELIEIDLQKAGGRTRQVQTIPRNKPGYSRGNWYSHDSLGDCESIIKVIVQRAT